MSDEPLIHDPGNETRIETVYVFLSIDAHEHKRWVAKVFKPTPIMRLPT